MKTRSLSALAAVLAAATMSGCTLSPNAKSWLDDTKARFTKKEEPVVVVEATSKPVTDKPQRTNRELTLAWDNIGRAGAAVHQPDYVHVLGEGNGRYEDKNTEFGINHGASSSNKGAAGGATYTPRKGQGYSFYELQRWSRYCDNGKGMDERDWRFVASEQYNAPLDAIPNCKKPAHDYAGYLESWKRFCSHSPQYSGYDILVVRNSVRPTQLANRCSRLQ